MDKKGTVIFILVTISILLSVGILTNTEYVKEVTTHKHYISMKWIEEQLLDTDYYFEFDNTTEFIIDVEFSNPSYIYHKYEIGDIIEWNTTKHVIGFKKW